MMLSLFYAEELKELLVSTLRVSDHWKPDGKKRFKKGTKFNYATRRISFSRKATCRKTSVRSWKR